MARKYAVIIDESAYIGDRGQPVRHLVQAKLMTSREASDVMSDQAQYGARVRFVAVDVDDSGEVPVMQMAREGE